MPRTDLKAARRKRIKKGIRSRIFGTEQRPRLSVFRSNTSIYAQIINDVAGITLVSCSSRIKEISANKATKSEKSFLVGKVLAEKALAAGISAVAFDRNGFKYHGRVKALADGAREGGLSF